MVKAVLLWWAGSWATKYLRMSNAKCLDACLLIVKSLDSQNTCNVLYISEWKGRNCKSFLYKGSTIRWHIFMYACIILDGTRESRCIYVRHFFIAQWGRCGIMNVTKRWFIKCNQKSLVNDILVWFLFIFNSIMLECRFNKIFYGKYIYRACFKKTAYARYE